MRKRMLTLILVGTTIISLVGCQQSKTGLGPTPTKQEPQGESTVGDWTTPYEETVTLSVARAASTTEFEAGDDITNNIWTRSYLE